MKYAALIVLFCVSRLFSQVGPPDLRCLEVLPNGNVILTWVPPADPGNVFSHYEIFTGISKSGPFSLISPTAAPISITNTLHAANSASAQTIFYYMQSVELDGDRSATSDTLQTIFLNVLVSDPALKINYNNISTPPHPGANSNFTITKEYPIGSTNPLTVTPATSFNDVISVCNAKINYQVQLSDFSGCFSKSNTIYGTYDDTKYPDTTYIDSISVLPDGRTTLSWEVTSDADVDTYLVIKRLPGGTNSVIDAVPGRTLTSFTYSSTEANDKIVSIFIAGQDSCRNKPGPFDQRPATMHMIAQYDHCGYRTNLAWNAYNGMKKGVKHYKIYHALAGGTFSVVGITTNTLFTHEGVEPEKDVCYFVRVVNGDETITASSNRTCFFSTQVGVPGFFYLRRASVNRAQDVDLDIAIDATTRFATIDIQRSLIANAGFETVAAIPYSGVEAYSFIDTEAETGSSPFYYKAVLRDSCGNARSESNTCRTIFLQVSDGGEDLFRRRLTWTAYEGFAGDVQEYNIFRIVNDEQNPPIIATTGAGVFTYTDDLENIAAEGAAIAYGVQAIERPGSPFFFRDACNSNVCNVYVEGRIFVPNAFTPNGLNKIWLPVTHFVSKTDYIVRVFNRWGHEVFYSRDDTQGWDGQGCPEGPYVYLISYRNGRGEYKEQKGTVLLIR